MIRKILILYKHLFILFFFYSTSIFSAQTFHQLGNDILYYIMVDRFYDGDEGNNIPDYAFPVEGELTQRERAYNTLNRELIKHTYDPDKKFLGLYWGGDLRGIIKKLDYLQELGITKIVLSPIQDNTNGWLYNPEKSYKVFTENDPLQTRNYKEFMNTAYHGYWTRDWFEIDEHFRDSNVPHEKRYDIFRELLQEASKRNIGVILDITLNHTTPSMDVAANHNNSDKTKGFSSYIADFGSIYKQGELVGRAIDFSTGEYNPDGWFHEKFDIHFHGRTTQREVQEGMLPGGLLDLNQKNPVVKKYLFEAVRFWLTFNEGGAQICGFRLDAIKHVHNEFWVELENFIRTIRPEAILIGEYFDGGFMQGESIEWISQHEKMSMFDFSLSVATRRFFAFERNWLGRPYIIEENFLGAEGSYYRSKREKKFKYLLKKFLNPAQVLEVSTKNLKLIEDSNSHLEWITFVESHDLPRLKSIDKNLSDRSYKNAIMFQFASRGIPLIHYGSEIALSFPYHKRHTGLFGLGGDPYNRPQMVWPGDKDFNHDVYGTVRKMINIRKKYPVLRYGETKFVHPSKSSREKDIFMIRYKENNYDKYHNILFAYSSDGGEYGLDFDRPPHEIVIIASTGRNNKVRVVNSRVFVTIEKNSSFIADIKH